jgi:hypothetical protein
MEKEEPLQLAYIKMAQAAEQVTKRNTYTGDQPG